MYLVMWRNFFHFLFLLGSVVTILSITDSYKDIARIYDGQEKLFDRAAIFFNNPIDLASVGLIIMFPSVIYFGFNRSQTKIPAKLFPLIIWVILISITFYTYQVYGKINKQRQTHIRNDLNLSFVVPTFWRVQDNSHSISLIHPKQTVLANNIEVPSIDINVLRKSETEANDINSIKLEAKEINSKQIYPVTSEESSPILRPLTLTNYIIKTYQIDSGHVELHLIRIDGKTFNYLIKAVSRPGEEKAMQAYLSVVLHYFNVLR